MHLIEIFESDTIMWQILLRSYPAPNLQRPTQIRQRLLIALIPFPTVLSHQLLGFKHHLSIDKLSRDRNIHGFEIVLADGGKLTDSAGPS